MDNPINELQHFIKLLSHFCNTQMIEQSQVTENCSGNNKESENRKI